MAGYGVYRDGTSVGSPSATTFDFGGLTCGTSYTLAVDAYDAAGNRSAKASATAATSPCPSLGAPVAAYSFDPKPVVARLPEATVFMGVPTLYVRLLAEPSFTREACHGMRLFISGSAPLLIETFNEFRERSGHTILERYGMSETVMLTSNPYDGERRGGTVGLPLPGVGVRVRDEQGRPCPSGESIVDSNVVGARRGMNCSHRGGTS